MDKTEAARQIELLLRSRRYSQKERDKIIKLFNANWGTRFDNVKNKFTEARYTGLGWGMTYSFVVLDDIAVKLQNA